jgi:hypothetical protein
MVLNGISGNKLLAYLNMQINRFKFLYLKRFFVFDKIAANELRLGKHKTIQYAKQQAKLMRLEQYMVN